VAFVCKQWFHITRDNELWKARYLTLPNPSDIKEDNYLASESYVAKAAAGSATTSFLWRSWLCCVQSASCLSVLTALWSLSMPISGKDSNSLAARLDFGHFTYRRFRQSYLYDLANTIVPYAEKRRQVLLACLQSRHSSEVSQATLTSIAIQHCSSLPERQAHLQVRKTGSRH